MKLFWDEYTVNSLQLSTIPRVYDLWYQECLFDFYRQPKNGTGLNHLSVLSHCKISKLDVEELQVVGDWWPKPTTKVFIYVKSELPS